MSSKFETYASDIAEAINDLEVDGLPEAFVDLLPNGNFGEYSEPAVRVMPSAFNRSNETKTMHRYEAAYNVLFVTPADKTDLPKLLQTIDTLASGLQRSRVTSGIVTGVEHSPIFDLDQLNQNGLFVAVLKVNILAIAQ
jgi:hypothetical protein